MSSSPKKKRKLQRVPSESEEEDSLQQEHDDDGQIGENFEPKKKKKKRESRKSKTDPAEWPSDDILKLFEQIELLLPKNDLMRYSRRLEKLDWEKVKFGQYSSVECSSVFNTMIKKVRQHQNVSDILFNMKSLYCRQPKVLLGSMIEHHGPKKPLTAYFLYIQDKKKKLQRKNPNLTGGEMSKLLSEKYKSLSPRKKQKYFDCYQASMETYKEEVAKLKEEHPDWVSFSSDDKTPRCPTASGLFIEDRIAKLREGDPELSYKQAQEEAGGKWKKLKNKKKLKWITKAIQYFENDYQAQCAAYQRIHPNFVPKTTCLSKQEQHLKEVSEGKPEKPPQNGFVLFKRSRFSEVQEAGRTLTVINNQLYKEWQALTEEQRQDYKKQVAKAKQEYAIAYKEYLDSLPEERRQQETRKNVASKKNVRNKKTGNVVANGQVDDADSDGETPSTSGNSHKVNGMSKEPIRSALSFYIEEQCKEMLGSDSDTSESDLTVPLAKKFKKLPDEEKEKYRKMAAKQKQQAQKNNNSPSAKRGLKKTFPGEPQKPPMSGYALFSRKLLSELTDVRSTERMAVIGQRWKQLSATEVASYNKKAKKKVQKYAEEIEAFKQMVSTKGGKCADQELTKIKWKGKAKSSGAAKKCSEYGQSHPSTSSAEVFVNSQNAMGSLIHSEHVSEDEMDDFVIETNNKVKKRNMKRPEKTMVAQSKASFSGSIKDPVVDGYNIGLKVSPKQRTKVRAMLDTVTEKGKRQGFSDVSVGFESYSVQSHEEDSVCHKIQSPDSFKIEIDNADDDTGSEYVQFSQGRLGANITGGQDASNKQWERELRICLTRVDEIIVSSESSENIGHCTGYESACLPTSLTLPTVKIESGVDNVHNGDGILSPDSSSSTVYELMISQPHIGCLVESSTKNSSYGDVHIKPEIQNIVLDNTNSSQDTGELSFECKPEVSDILTGSDELFSSGDSNKRNNLGPTCSQNSVNICSEYSDCGAERSVFIPSQHPVLSGSIIDQVLEAYETLNRKPLDLVAAEILSSIKITAGDARSIEAATREQSKCEAWYYHRRGRITASAFAEIGILGNDTNKKMSLLKKLLADVRYPTSSWGLDHEETALEAYRKRMYDHHNHLKLVDSGFVINPRFPHLGATPDSWVECTCCGRGVVEVKCPVYLPAFKPCRTSRCSFTFLQHHDKTLPLCVNSLPQSHSHYYQVQGQMAVCDVQYCDFVCWTPKEMHVERIVRDYSFFSDLKLELDSFFLCDVIPAIVSENF